MPDAVAHTRVKKAPSTLSSVVLADTTKALEAIHQAFPYEGDLRVRVLWSGEGIMRCRANWFRQVAGETVIVRSLFLSITNTAGGLVVKDETTGRGC